MCAHTGALKQIFDISAEGTTQILIEVEFFTRRGERYPRRDIRLISVFEYSVFYSIYSASTSNSAKNRINSSTRNL